MANLVITDLVAILNARIGDLARALLGEPNSRLSNKAQLRFGSKGSVVVEIEGPNAGKWFDHEAGIGGAGLELIRHRRGGSLGAAVDWAGNGWGSSKSLLPTTFLNRPPNRPHRG